MPNHLQGPPSPDEHNSYYGKYIMLVPETYFITALEGQTAAGLKLLRGLPENRASHRYEVGKWSVKQVIGHVADTERIFAFRALAFARGDRAAIPGMDPDEYMKHSNFDDLTLADLVGQYETVRRASQSLFAGMTPEAWIRRGNASQNEFSVRALAYILIGHERHHWKILHERYLA